MVDFTALINVWNTCTAGSSTYYDSCILLGILLPDRKQKSVTIRMVALYPLLLLNSGNSDQQL